MDNYHTGKLQKCPWQDNTTRGKMQIEMDNNTYFHNLPDGQFIKLCEEFHSLNEESEKVKRIIYHDSHRFTGLFGPVERAIDNNLYSYGFNVPNQWRAEILVNIAIEIIAQAQFAQRVKSLEERFSKCEQWERIAFLEAEAGEITSAAMEVKKHGAGSKNLYLRAQFLGYRNCGLGWNAYRFDYFDSFPESFNPEKVPIVSYALGWTLRKYEIYFKAHADVQAGHLASPTAAPNGRGLGDVDQVEEVANLGQEMKLSNDLEPKKTATGIALFHALAASVDPNYHLTKTNIKNRLAAEEDHQGSLQDIQNKYEEFVKEVLTPNDGRYTFKLGDKPGNRTKGAYKDAAKYAIHKLKELQTCGAIDSEKIVKQIRIANALLNSI